MMRTTGPATCASCATTGFTSGLTTLIVGNVPLVSLDFQNAPSGLRISSGFGGPYTLTVGPGNVIRESTCSGDQTLELPFFMQATGSWNVSGPSGRLRVTGNISGSTGANLVKDGNGELALLGTGSWTGTTTVHDGRLTVSNANGLPAKALVVNGAAGQSPSVYFTTSLTPQLPSIQVTNGKLLGASSANLSSPTVDLYGTSELGAHVIGSSYLTAKPGASVVISSGQSFAGTAAVMAGASVTGGSEFIFGPVGNSVVLDDGAHVTLTSSHTMSHFIATSGAPNASATLDGVFTLSSTVVGPAALHLVTSPTQLNVTVNGSSPSFTGKWFRSTGSLIAASPDCLGQATLIQLQGVSGALDIQADQAVTVGATPTLALGSNGTLLNNTHDVTFGELQVGFSSNVIMLSQDGTPTNLSFSSITASSGGTLGIRYWTGTAGQPGAEDRIFVASAPTQAVLDSITFFNVGGMNRHAMVINGNELVPKP
jgi:autotransporter-associated beta strand protein